MTPSEGSDRRPPSVDSLARQLAHTGLPHPLLVDVAREAIAAGAPASAGVRAEELRRRFLAPVINATGVLLHTNLGRAPLQVDQPASYSNLELDLASGERGSRHDHAGSLLARAAGAERAVVVNNGAAAVMLTLAALARGRGVAVSRGELVQLGGGFRLPDVMIESGAHLVEVGTTNRTTVADYSGSLDDPRHDVGLVLKVHQSNFRIVGFTEAATVTELAALDVPLAVDLGSGLLDVATPWLRGGPPSWLSSEPAVRQTLAAGADLVIFSGDKLLGGPQAGIIAGRADLVDLCAQHPLYRAMRPGSLVLGALQDVVLTYLRGDAAQLPLWAMAGATVADLTQRADRIRVDHAMGADVRTTDLVAVVGGGSAPGVEIPSWGFEVPGDHAAALRRAEPLPIIARVRHRRTTVDLRTVAPEHDAALGHALAGLSAS
ncbi:MAG: L-seryl-tRNA(Sec) selenium transferase [Acidimicrobiia bacterium]|nr:L-seryl-tRNA(Sec) selenium transferase [Acidimicrobiia bacterium]